MPDIVRKTHLDVRLRPLKEKRSTATPCTPYGVRSVHRSPDVVYPLGGMPPGVQYAGIPMVPRSVIGGSFMCFRLEMPGSDVVTRNCGDGHGAVRLGFRVCRDVVPFIICERLAMRLVA